jgi:hypothetical protein
MNLHVARRAVLIARIRQVVIRRRLLHTGVESRAETSEIALAIVAFKTNRENRRAAQQPGVHRSVRLMTGFTAFYAHRPVLKDKRSAFINMAVKTRLFSALFLIHHVWPR